MSTFSENSFWCCWVTSVMSDSVRPHRRQPTRLPRPWDSPGKNTGMGCHFLFQCMKVKSESEVAQSCPTLSDPMDCGLPGSSIHGIFQARVLEGGPLPSLQFLVKYANKKRINQAGCYISCWGLYHPEYVILLRVPWGLSTFCCGLWRTICLLSLLFYPSIKNNGGKNKQWGRDSLFNRWFEKNNQIHVKEWN